MDIGRAVRDIDTCATRPPIVYPVVTSLSVGPWNVIDLRGCRLINEVQCHCHRTCSSTHQFTYTCWNSEANHDYFSFFSLIPNSIPLLPHALEHKLQDRVLIVQGGYVSQSQGTTLNVTKKSNVLDKPKPNILNASKKTNHESNNNNSTDASDSTPVTRHESSGIRHEAPVAAAPEVTVGVSVSSNTYSDNSIHVSFLGCRPESYSRRDSQA